MGKKYFAKYLPVEGEIKEGDYWIGDGISIPKQATRLEEKASEAVQKAFGIKYRKDFLKLKNAKKVNLFLCSRDIKHGDKYHDYAGAPVFTHDEDDPMLDKDCFKIIGEISPNATWVKEGDEFDEEDIFMTYVDDAGTVWKNTEVGALTGYTGEFTPRCMLKCSTCKTFH